MLKIGLTGNIGSGKTTITMVFKILGVPVYLADDEAKKLLLHTEIINKLINKFGNTVLTNNNIDRKKLAALVFADADALQWLNHLIHPLIKTDFDQWLTLLPRNSQYVIQEAAILFESGFNVYVDKTILITAPENLRMQRVMQRDGVTAELFMQRATNQWIECRKQMLADYNIINDDTQLVIPQILELHQKFMCLA